MSRRHRLPAEVYALVEQTPGTVLLEGGKLDFNAPREEPWTQLFTAPLRVCAAYAPAEIPALFAAIESAVARGQYAAGFFTYECASCFEPKSRPRTARPGTPLAWFGIYERSCAFDHDVGAFIGSDPPELEQFRDARPSAPAERDVPAEPDALKGHDFSRAKQTEKNAGALALEEILTADFALNEAEYAQRIASIHESIRAGDVYQLNFTAPWQVRLRTPAPGSVAALYAHLRARQPAGYGALIHWQAGRHILSFSPELFFRVDQNGATRRIVTRPMKGTAPRGRTTREDREIAAWLRNDPKNRSENVMIVDLLRNDLGRLSRFGSVGTEKLFAAERYPTLWQMTSTVTAELRPEVGYYDIFRALFPCGSVTGAPKVRAMQLIAELESEPRGVYTGAIGFISSRQTIFNVAIRTLEMEGDRGTMGCGSGIVIDSDPAEEYRECLLKAEFLTPSVHHEYAQTRQPRQFSLIESMLWDGAYPLLELHLDRLVDSAEYFDIACERAEVKAALLEYASAFPSREPRKVRLLVDCDGGLQISDEVLPAVNGEPRIGRVRISEKRTDPSDPMLFHKTTQRPLYAQAFAEAVRDGLDDVLFLNLRNEGTEGAISNVFIQKDGRWFTPPVESGLLAGVYRRHLLETRPEIKERVLTLDDLCSADAVYLCNAVRGLRRVEILW